MRIEDYIENQEKKLQEILLFLHPWLTEEIGLHCKMRYGIPFYDDREWICYLNPLKRGGIEFAFINGKRLDTADNLLESKGRKQVWGIALKDIESIPLKALKAKLNEAIKKQKIDK